MKQQTCNPNWLDEFLQNKLSETEEQQFTRHLDECADCREELESRAAERSEWQEAASLLGGAGGQAVSTVAEHPAPAVHSPQIGQILSQLAPTDDPESLGRIGGYEVTGVVGAGGMGVVLKAHDRSLDRIVAIKVMSPHLASHGSARRRFAREAKAAAAVLHPNVIAIHSVASDEDCPYLVMPYLRGASLQKRIDSQGPLPLKETLRIAAQIAAGLAAAHEQGLVHRDIKPANILLEEGVERVTITDFGLARAVDDASMTRSGVIAGTPQYMSPEQTRGEPIDARSDLFSLGSVLYSMCAGRSPFRAETTFGVLHRIANDEPTSLREVNSNVPIWLGHIIDRLMAKRPDDRFESAKEVAELLEDCLAHVQQPATTPLPASAAELVKSFDSRPNGSPRTLGGFRFPPIGKFIATAAFGFSLIFAGVLIVLELNKGTLTIESEADDVPIRIMQGKEVVKQLIVSRRGFTTRLSAGNYVIEVDAKGAAIQIRGNEVTLKRGKSTLARITLANQAQVSRDESRLIQRLQGKWRVVRIVDPEGADFKPRKISGWIFEGHNATSFGERINVKLPFHLDEAESPAHFDMMIEDESNSDFLGLVDVTGDTMKLISSQNAGGKSDPIRPVALIPTLGFRYCEMERVVEAENANLDDAGNAGHGLYAQEPTEILTPEQAMVHGYLQFLEQEVGPVRIDSSVTVQFRVGSVAKQIRYGDYSAWYLCPSENPGKLGKGVLRVWIGHAVENALKEQGITDLEAHFSGKTVFVSGAVSSNPYPAPILYGGLTSSRRRGGPQTWAHSMELETIDQLTVHDSPLPSFSKSNKRDTNQNSRLALNTNESPEDASDAPIIWGIHRNGMVAGAKLLSATGRLQPGDPVVVQFVLKNETDEEQVVVLQQFGGSHPVLGENNRLELNILSDSQQKHQHRIQPGEILEQRQYRVNVATTGMPPGEYRITSSSAFWMAKEGESNGSIGVPFRKEIPFTLGAIDSAALQQPTIEDDPTRRIYWGKPVANLVLGMRLPPGRQSWPSDGVDIEGQLFLFNAGNEPIDLTYELPSTASEWNMHLTSRDNINKPVRLDSTWYSGYAPRRIRRVKLTPGESIAVTGIRAGVSTGDAAPVMEEIGGPIVRILKTKTEFKYGDPNRLIGQVGRFEFHAAMTINVNGLSDVIVIASCNPVPFAIVDEAKEIGKGKGTGEISGGKEAAGSANPILNSRVIDSSVEGQGMKARPSDMKVDGLGYQVISVHFTDVVARIDASGNTATSTVQRVVEALQEAGVEKMSLGTIERVDSIEPRKMMFTIKLLNDTAEIDTTFAADHVYLVKTIRKLKESGIKQIRFMPLTKPTGDMEPRTETPPDDKTSDTREGPSLFPAGKIMGIPMRFIIEGGQSSKGYTVEKAVARYNQATSKDRRTLFTPAIPDLTEEQFKKALLAESEKARTKGRVALADMLADMGSTGSWQESCSELFVLRKGSTGKARLAFTPAFLHDGSNVIGLPTLYLWHLDGRASDFYGEDLLEAEKETNQKPKSETSATTIDLPNKLQNQPLAENHDASSDHFSTPEALLKHLADCQYRDDLTGVVSCWTDELAQTFATSNLMLAGIMLQDFENNPDRNWSPGTPKRLAELKKLLSEQIADQSGATAAMAFGLATQEAMAGKNNFGKSIEAGADAPMVQLLSAVTAEHLKDPREFIARFDEICDGDEEEPKTEKTFSYRITEQKGDTAIATDLEGNQMELQRTENSWRLHDPFLSVPVRRAEDDDKSEFKGPSKAIPDGTR